MKSDLIQQYQHKTNQKLLYARLTLELLEQREEPYIAALKESYVSHLLNAYDALVGEIQARLNILPHMEPNPVALFHNMQRTEEVAATEMHMLVRLEEDPHSWLNSLRRMQAKALGRPQNRNAQLLNYKRSAPDDMYTYLEELENLCKQIRALMTEY